MEEIINKFGDKIKCIKVNFEDASWRKELPSKAGWYLIKTDTPIEVLKSVGPSKHKAHTDIPKAIDANFELQNLGITISPKKKGDSYIVYNGETKNLKARAREHINGHPKTYCLGLAEYKELYKYNWKFCYVASSELFADEKQDNKQLRLAVEQIWRVKNGWPILSKK